MQTITTSSAAKLLGINERSVRKAADRGYLRCSWGDTGHGISGRIFTIEALAAYSARKRALFGAVLEAATVSEETDVVVF